MRGKVLKHMIRPGFRLLGKYLEGPPGLKVWEGSLVPH